MNSLNDRLRHLSPEAREAARQFPLRIPPALAMRIPWEVDGPLTRQFLPAPEELNHAPGDAIDPLRERQAQGLPGMLIKYTGRALLKVTTECAVHCRFCFRRHLREEPLPRRLRDWEPALAAIARDHTLKEVIYSGGDPLTLSDRRLARLTARLAAIPHLTRLRIHTRMPVVTPERVQDSLLDWMKATRLTPLLVVHVNHADELHPSARAALEKLVEGGIPVLSQSVLLKGINDNLEALTRLYETLIDARVIPYYLHMLDPVAGAGHFQVSDAHALRLMAGLQERLPGYGVPRLVREEPGARSKTGLPSKP
ncbi:MAG: KamA family radical SAM protein [Magnetococcales bacterium]|nr:KamA family radical SAM protein [Magnetococcales bacterium]